MPSRKSKKKAKPAPLLMVDWDDAATPDPMEWKDVSTDTIGGLVRVRTVGYLAYRDKRTLTLMQTVTDDGGCAGEWNIPVGCITKITRLR